MTGVALLVSGDFLATTNIEAAEKKPVGETVQTEPFQDLKDTDSIIALPTGEYLHGKSITASKDNPDKILETYDSEAPIGTKNKGIKRMSVTEARKEIKNNLGVLNLSFPSVKTNVPPTQNQIVFLYPGAGSWQNLSIGAHWQFSRTYFAPSENTGIYLLWKAHKDDGRIADINDCGQMYFNGGTYGALIKARSPASYYTSSDSGYHEMAFASWTPKSGTSYEVYNK